MVNGRPFLLFLLGVFSAMTLPAHAEVAADLAFIVAHHPPGGTWPDSVVLRTPGSTNELKFFLERMIRMYQLFISSQDAPACNFTPSCSRFAGQALDRYGIFYGVLVAADRLQRCNGFAHKYYPVHPETGRCDDPVETYYLGNE